MQPLEQMLSTILKEKQRIMPPRNSENPEFLNIMERIRKQKYDVLHKIIRPSEVDLVRPEITESWIRSYELGLNLFKPNEAPILDDDSFQAILKEKDLLLSTAQFYILQLKNMLYGSDCVIILTDEKGVVLNILEAQDKVLNDETHMMPGEIWSESTVGTCSHVLCALMESPIQMCGPEHYSESFKYTTASSAPIFDANDTLIGTLSIASKDYDSQNPHTLGLAVSMSWAIQNKLISTNSNEMIHATLEAYRDAVITINKHRIITKSNRLADSLLNNDNEELAGKNIEQVLGFLPEITAVLETGEPIFNTQTIIEKSNHKLSLYSLRPIKNANDKVTGCVLNLSTVDQPKKEIAVLSSSAPKVTFDTIVGSSQPMIKAIEMTRKFASIGSNILIEGESGTGKELFAQSIHNQARTQGPFMVLNCAAIPENLIESELFGYEGGAFTGAERQGKPGKIEIANGGTLFLDEIGDMPLELQPVLLRVLEDRKIMRVGGSKYIPIDFNLVAATNKNLLEMVRRHEFREDLYYRLAVFKISLPPLRDRSVDILRLAMYFIKKTADRQQMAIPILSESTKEILIQYNWPGNVRQLENAMVYAVNMSEKGVILPEDLPAQIKDTFDTEYVEPSRDSQRVTASDHSNLSIREMEKVAILQALKESDNNIGEAAEILGLSKSTLYRRIKDFHIPIK